MPEPTDKPPPLSSFSPESWGCLGMLIVAIVFAAIMGAFPSFPGGKEVLPEAPVASAPVQSPPTIESVGIESAVRPLAFDACLALIVRTAEDLGVAPVNIVETSIVRMVRFPVTDGSVMITCSKLDQNVVITRSPNR